MNKLYATDPQQIEPLDSGFGEAQMSNGDIVIYHDDDPESQFIHFQWRRPCEIPTRRIK